MGKIGGVHYGEQADWAVGRAPAARPASLARRRQKFPEPARVAAEQGGVFLPANVQTISLPLSAGKPLNCQPARACATNWRNSPTAGAAAGRPGAGAASEWPHPDDGWVAEAPEILTFARLALAIRRGGRS